MSFWIQHLANSLVAAGIRLVINTLGPFVFNGFALDLKLFLGHSR